MTSYFRLRQICLADRDLARATADIEAIFGVRACYRDPAVATYGLDNVLFPFGRAFLEIVSPTQDGTAAGRFIDRGGGVGGYMAIFSCDDVERRAAHARDMAIAIAHTMDHAPFYGVQLHPRDCRATMIEFDRTAGGEALDGPYAPAGPDWQRFVTTEVTRGIRAIEIESPDPAGIAAHWAAILERPLSPDRTIATETIDIAFVAGETPRECLRTLVVDVVDPPVVAMTARLRGYRVEQGAFTLGGVRFRFD